MNVDHTCQAACLHQRLAHSDLAEHKNTAEVEKINTAYRYDIADLNTL
jgi:hypothetical protein